MRWHGGRGPAQRGADGGGGGGTPLIVSTTLIARSITSATMLSAQRAAAALTRAWGAAGCSAASSLGPAIGRLADASSSSSSSIGAALSPPALVAPLGSRQAHSGKDVHATTVLCVRKDGQASVTGASGERLCLAPPPPPRRCRCGPPASAILKCALAPLRAAGGACGRRPGHHGRHRGQAQCAQDPEDWGARDWRLCRCAAGMALECPAPPAAAATKPSHVGSPGRRSSRAGADGRAGGTAPRLPQAPRPTRSRCLSGWRPSWRSTRGS